MLSVHCPSKSFHIHALVLIILDRRRRVAIAFHKKGSGFMKREDPKMLSYSMYEQAQTKDTQIGFTTKLKKKSLLAFLKVMSSK